MKQKHNCLYCNAKEGIYKLADWNKENIFRYYCEDHIKIAASFNNKQKNDFYEYYLESSRRSSLPEKSLKLWKKIHESKKNY